MNLITVLEKTVSPDTSDLETAQQFLEQAAQQNLPELLKQLSDILKHGGNSPAVRMQAGLQLKNALYSKDHATRLQYQQRWLQFPDDVRLYIKDNVLQSLGTETTRPSSAAQCVAYIACAELSHRFWPELIPILTQNVTNQNSTEMVKESTLETIGYICQDIEPDILAAQSNEILTAIVNGMRKEEQSNHVRLAATNALLNSLEFTKANFDKEDLAWMMTFYLKIIYLYTPILGIWGTLAYYLLIRCLESHWFTWVSQSNHIPMEIVHDKADPWVFLQMQATCDVEQSFFNDWFTGHLNFQIEHHLFPTMPRHNLYKIAPLVKSLCDKHGIKYEVKPLYTAFKDVVLTLKHSGEIWYSTYNALYNL